ncbi:MAG: hypothetical protein Q8R28_22155 [Dehalococcoidia bacterium]|nr:hypothetical protein [Dehalococcoidia bacterium]
MLVRDGNPDALELKEALERAARFHDLLAAGARVFAQEGSARDKT